MGFNSGFKGLKALQTSFSHTDVVI